MSLFPIIRDTFSRTVTGDSFEVGINVATIDFFFNFYNKNSLINPLRRQHVPRL